MKRYSMYRDFNKEFYFYLGLISTNFAIVEFNIIKFLGKLIIDDFVLTNTILERNSLAQNIELLKKLTNGENMKQML